MRVEERAAQPVACVHRPVPDRLVDEIGQAIRAVLVHLAAVGVRPTGPPYARSTWVPGTDLEIGFPVAEPIAGDGRVVPGALPGGRVALTRHVGPHDAIAVTAARLRAWIAGQGLSEAGVPWRTFVTNPREVPDPARWENDVVYPVRDHR